MSIKIFYYEKHKDGKCSDSQTSSSTQIMGNPEGEGGQKGEEIKLKYNYQNLPKHYGKQSSPNPREMCNPLFW